MPISARACKVQRLQRLQAPRRVHNRGQHHPPHPGRAGTAGHAGHGGSARWVEFVHFFTVTFMQSRRRGSLGDDLPARILRRCTLALIYVLAILCRLHKVSLAIRYDTLDPIYYSPSGRDGTS